MACSGRSITSEDASVCTRASGARTSPCAWAGVALSKLSPLSEIGEGERSRDRRLGRPRQARGHLLRQQSEARVQAAGAIDVLVSFRSWACEAFAAYIRRSA